MRGRALLRQLFVDTPSRAATQPALTADQPQAPRSRGWLATLFDVRVDAPAQPTFAPAVSHNSERQAATRDAALPLAARTQAR
jgi:hypothetical protein